MGETHDNLKLEKTIKALDADQYQACNNDLCQFTVMPHWRVSVMIATLVGLLSSLLYSVVLHPTRRPYRLIFKKVTTYLSTPTPRLSISFLG